MLRKAILVYGVVALAGALLLLSAGAFLPLALYFLVNGAVILGAIFLERGRYSGLHFRDDTSRWEPTGERFIDPTTGDLIEVMYDPKTGLRNYAHPRDGGPPARK